MADYYTAQIAQNVRAIRHRRGWSAEAVARRSSGLISRNTITNLENHRRDSLTLDEASELALALDVPLGALMNLDERGCAECIRKNELLDRISRLVTEAES